MSASREPLHVLYLIDSLAGGGAERSLAALAPAYAARDLRLTVAYLHERPGVRADLEAAGAAVRSLEGPWGLAGAAARARRLVAATRPDLVHTTLFEADLVGRAAAGRVPVVTSLVNDAYGAALLEAVGPPERSAVNPARRQVVATDEARLVRASDQMVGELALPRADGRRSDLRDDVDPTLRDEEDRGRWRPVFQATRRGVVVEMLGIERERVFMCHPTSCLRLEFLLQIRSNV